jgi:hypothetical protein
MQQGADKFDEPGGRLLTVTKERVLRDGPRPAPFRYTSPIWTYAFINLPGRPSGSSPQDPINPQQRWYNRLWGNVGEHAHLVSNPIGIADTSQGVKREHITNETGLTLEVNRNAGGSGEPFSWVRAPELGSIVLSALQGIKGHIDEMGQTEGSTGRAPSRDPSGELIRELRFNSDRPVASPLKRATLEHRRLIQDWMVMIPTIWTGEKLVTWTGHSSIPRAVMYLPELMEPERVKVSVDIESMLPEGRGERQNRVMLMRREGLFGDPLSPEAISHTLELARFPHLGRATRPGGVHREKAEDENGALVMGTPASGIPIYEWQDHAVHLFVHEQLMASTDFARLPIEVQQEFVAHRNMTLMAIEQVAMLQAQREARVGIRRAAIGAAAEGEAMDLAEAVGPEPPGLPDGASAGEGRPPAQDRPTAGATVS